MEKTAILNIELETFEKYGNHTVKVSEIYNGTFKEAPTYPVYTLGQEITVGGEKFFVITENDDSSKDSIILISKYNLSLTEGNKQDESEDTTGWDTSVNFCTDPTESYEGYWKNIDGITYPYDLNKEISERATVINKARAYGTSKGGAGRLLTYEEAENLKDKINNVIFGTYIISAYSMSYWLSSAADYQNVWLIYGGNLDYTGYWGTMSAGVRPVITILKANI